MFCPIRQEAQYGTGFKLEELEAQQHIQHGGPEHRCLAWMIARGPSAKPI